MTFIYGIYDPLWILMCLPLPFQFQLKKITKNDYYIIENRTWIIIMLQKLRTHGFY